MISDDTDRKEPALFLMDLKGHIGMKLLIDGLGKINDMEAITADTRSLLYVLASQSFNRKGEQPPARKLLVRIRRRGMSFSLDKCVMLSDLLLAAANETGASEWSDFVGRAAREKTVDIEGMAFTGDTLLLGFKNPKMGNDAVILAVADPDSLFERKRLSPEKVSLWRRITVYDSATGTFCGISDLLFCNGSLYGLSTGVASRSGVDGDVGVFWSYSPETEALLLLRSFPESKPEGIAFNGERSELCIVFDNGSKNPSQFMTVKVSR
ncbi:MAG: hypothetical protein JXA18_04405 [Chitinispirillaceae bacterium]|nr:hypothetical protein [Chitinispirillaceae bacterium]